MLSRFVAWMNGLSVVQIDASPRYALAPLRLEKEAAIAEHRDAMQRLREEKEGSTRPRWIGCVQNARTR